MTKPVCEHAGLDIGQFQTIGAEFLIVLQDVAHVLFRPVQPRPHQQSGADIGDVYMDGVYTHLLKVEDASQWRFLILGTEKYILRCPVAVYQLYGQVLEVGEPWE